MKIYLAHPISGLSYDEVVEYFDGAAQVLQAMGYDVIHPMTGKSYLRNEIKFKAEGYTNPASANHAIKERDKWMVSMSDIVLMDLSGAEHASIGCMMELAWGDLWGKHTLVVMEQENVHRHAFVLEAADIVYETLADAMTYLQKLAEGKV